MTDLPVTDSQTPITLGIVIGGFGLRGEVVVKVTGDSPEGLARYESFHWSPGSGRPGPADPAKSRKLVPEWVRPHKGKALVRFRGITHRVDAEALIGGLLWLPREELLPAGEDRFYIVDLIGLQVETTGGEPVGRIREVLENPANDIFVVEGEAGREILIPHVAAIVKEVSLEKRRVVIEPMPGLLD